MLSGGILPAPDFTRIRDTFHRMIRYDRSERGPMCPSMDPDALLHLPFVEMAVDS